MWKEVEALEYHAHLFTHLINICFARERNSVDNNLARRRLLEVIYAAEQRTLAGSRRPDDDDDFLLINREVNPLEDLIRAEGFAQSFDLNH